MIRKNVYNDLSRFTTTEKHQLKRLFSLLLLRSNLHCLSCKKKHYIYLLHYSLTQHKSTETNDTQITQPKPQKHKKIPLFS